MGQAIPILTAIGSALSIASTAKGLLSPPKAPAAPQAPAGLSAAENAEKAEAASLAKRKRFLATQRRKALNNLLVGGQLGFPSSQIGATGTKLGTG